MQLTARDIVNSRKVNELLLAKVNELFELEFVLKQKAQLKYLYEKQKKIQKRSNLMNLLSHEFLWQPTPAYYLFTVAVFLLAKHKWALRQCTMIPFLSLPMTMDYIKRDYYVSSFKKEKV